MAREFKCPGPVIERVRSKALLVPEDLGEPTRTVQVGPPWGTTKPHDTDGLVPEYEGDFGESEYLAVSKMRGTGVGENWTYRWHVLYNLTKILPLKPGLNDWRVIRRHERAHCRGFGHYEGSPDPAAPDYNPCYYPTVAITGT